MLFVPGTTGGGVEQRGVFLPGGEVASYPLGSYYVHISLLEKRCFGSLPSATNAMTRQTETDLVILEQYICIVFCFRASSMTPRISAVGDEIRSRLTFSFASPPWQDEAGAAVHVLPRSWLQQARPRSALGRPGGKLHHVRAAQRTGAPPAVPHTLVNEVCFCQEAYVWLRRF